MNTNTIPLGVDTGPIHQPPMQQPSLQQQSDNAADTGPQADSLSLGQLRKLVNEGGKIKVWSHQFGEDLSLADITEY